MKRKVNLPLRSCGSGMGGLSEAVREIWNERGHASFTVNKENTMFYGGDLVQSWSSRKRFILLTLESSLVLP